MDVRQKDDFTPLHLAAQAGYSDIVQVPSHSQIDFHASSKFTAST